MLKKTLIIAMFAMLISITAQSHAHGPKCIRLSYGLKLTYKVLGDADFIKDAKISREKANKIRKMVKQAARQMKRLNPQINRLQNQVHALLDIRPLPSKKIISLKRREHVLKWKKAYIKIRLRIAIERLFSQSQAAPFIKAMQKHCDKHHSASHSHHDHDH